jgi:hypothetical protein
MNIIRLQRNIFNHCFYVHTQDPDKKKCEKKCGQRCQGAGYQVGRKHVRQCGKYLKYNFGTRNKDDIHEGLQYFIDAAFSDDKTNQFMRLVLNWRKLVMNNTDVDFTAIFEAVYPGEKKENIVDIVSEKIPICGNHLFTVDFESVRWLLCLGETAFKTYQSVNNHMENRKENEKADKEEYEAYTDSKFITQSENFKELQGMLDKETTEYKEGILKLYEKNLSYYAIHHAYEEHRSIREDRKTQELLEKMKKIQIVN